MRADDQREAENARTAGVTITSGQIGGDTSSATAQTSEATEPTDMLWF